MVVADHRFSGPALFLRKISLPVGQDYGTRAREVEGNICVQIEGLVWKWRKGKLVFRSQPFLEGRAGEQSRIRVAMRVSAGNGRHEETLTPPVDLYNS
jgi:hypothetical protein